MADLLTLMTAGQHLAAGANAARNWVLARLSGLVRDLFKRCLSARTMRNDVRRSRAVRCLQLLRVAFRLTFVNPAVEVSLTMIATLKHAHPSLNDRLALSSCMRQVALLFFCAVGAKQLLFDLSTITFRGHALLACAAESFVAGPWAGVFSTRHHFSTYLTTAPSGIVICV